MRFLIEKNIPFVQGLLEPYGEVEYLAANAFTPETVKDADALMVRTRTRCDASLLEGSRCQMVATATIGTDHIDLPWCAAHGITVENAPGCNAPAVAQYVFASLLKLANRPLSQYRIGIVGVGHVGKIIEQWARQLDMEVMLCDPPRQQAEGGDHWSTLADIAREADIITFHTPLDETTHHLADADFFASLRRSPIIINSARGEVVDNQALLEALRSGQVHHAVMDCWEGEPAISLDLLRHCAIATPHIAGYSYEGKVRGTRMALDAICQHFGLPHIEMEQHAPMGAAASVNPKAIARSYDPGVDTAALKSDPASFESLRNHYNLRHEVHSGKID
ncbi:MAG: 4-phosphoerythronate dehydrogenase [Bacteroidales bacterium]|nr:4-phosphoerythronate dehydrogenase [Bacteroidales bacterium]